MHPQHQIGEPTLMLAQVVAGAGGAQYAHALHAIPPWLGGALSALVVGAALRVLDPTLRDAGELLRGAWRGLVARLRAR